MGRKKINEEEKNVVVTASVQPHQRDFIKDHPRFDFSKFVQIHLQDYMDLALEAEEIKEELLKNVKKA